MTFAINTISASSATLTMSSREIAELTGKRHDNVMYVCTSMKLAGVFPEIQETPYVHPQDGQTYMQFNLNKRDCLVLIARMCPEFAAAVTDRWQALEAAMAPSTYAEALMGVAQAEMARESLVLVSTKELESQAEKEDISEHCISEDEQTYSLEETAEKLGISMEKLLAAMTEMGWVESVVSE